MKYLLIGLLKAYRAVISPLYGNVCKYYPTCSAYALEAVTVHGALKGTWLAARRLGSCHPWAAGGYDPVPGTPAAAAWAAEQGQFHPAPEVTELNSLIPLLLPLNLWDDFLGLLSAMMTPLYWAVSGILVACHTLLTMLGMNPDWGGTWALSIVLLTMVIRRALIPLFVRQINSARNMQLMQPKVKELNEKYGHDRERLGQETMKLYKDEGVNPMASCLPLLLQMPIFLALFYVLNSVSHGTALGYFFETNPALVTSLKNATVFGAPISSTFCRCSTAFSLARPSSCH